MEDEEQKNLDAVLAEKARGQYGLISRTQALAEGMSSAAIVRRVQSELWLPMRCGVYRFAAVAVTWHQSLRAACLQIPNAVAYGKTAGWLHGLDGLGRHAPSRLQLAVPRDQHPRSPDLDLYRLRKLSGYWTHLHGIPVTHLPKTLIVLAGMLDEENAELALDSAIRPRPGLRNWIIRELAKHPHSGDVGAARLRRLMKLRITPSDSGLEVKLERLVRNAKLPEPTYRRPIFDEQGRIASVDLIWSEQRVIVQAHGWQWHGHRLRWEIDIAQRRRMSVDGWCIIEVTSADMRDQPAEILRLLVKGLRLAPILTDSRTKTAPDWA